MRLQNLDVRKKWRHFWKTEYFIEFMWIKMHKQKQYTTNGEGMALMSQTTIIFSFMFTFMRYMIMNHSECECSICDYSLINMVKILGKIIIN